MTSEDIHPTLREALSLHESFRRLGFIPDDIYVQPTSTEFFVLVIRDNKRFIAKAGNHEISLSVIAEEWTRAANWWNSEAKEKTRQEIYRSSKTFGQKVGLIAALLENGFNIRESDA